MQYNIEEQLNVKSYSTKSATKRTLSLKPIFEIIPPRG